MAIILYGIDISPAFRAVKMMIEALNLKVEEKPVNLFNGDHLKPEYLKINPLHTIPAINDNGFIVYDSHAILFYLANKYGKDFYPDDIEKRTVIEQRMHFDSGCFFPRARAIMRPIILGVRKDIPEENLKELLECYGFIETFLEKSPWIAGDFLSIADISITASVAAVSLVVPIDPEKYPKLTAWLEKIKQKPFYSANIKGLMIAKELFSSKMA